MPDIIYEDNHLIAVYKKAGQPVQPEPGKPSSLDEEVRAYIKETYNKPGDVFLGVIHRIDMPVSGLVLLAKTSKALTRMNEIFRSRKVKKTYRALVEGIPAKNNDILEHYLRRDEQRNFTKAHIKEVENSILAVLDYKIIKSAHNISLLEVNLHTGRKHQIRAQFSAIGHPIVGDIKYGAKNALQNKSIALESYSLEFIHPVNKLRLEICCAKTNLEL